MIIVCPHCGGSVEVLEINCKIFRHGIIKKNGKQMNPHLPKNECDDLFEKDLIWGCGKPFKYDGNKVEICEYI